MLTTDKLCIADFTLFMIKGLFKNTNTYSFQTKNAITKTITQILYLIAIKCKYKFTKSDLSYVYCFIFNS